MLKYNEGARVQRKVLGQMTEFKISINVNRHAVHSQDSKKPLCMQAKKAAKPKKVVHRLDPDADDISMDDDSGDSDFGAPKKVPIRPSVEVELVTCQLLTYTAGRCQHRLTKRASYPEM